MDVGDAVANLAGADASVFEEWMRSSAGVSPDGTYTQATALATVLSRRLIAGEMGSVQAVMASVEKALAIATPELRDLLIVGLIEDVQIALLNQEVALTTVLPLLGPLTTKAWVAVTDLWDGRMTPAAFSRFVERPRPDDPTPYPGRRGGAE